MLEKRAEIYSFLDPWICVHNQFFFLTISLYSLCFRGIIITHTRHYYGDSKSQGTGVIAQNHGGGYSGEEQSRKVSKIQSVDNGCYYRDIFSLCSRLHQNFTKSEHFKVGTALVTLLQQPDLLSKASQRLAAITFLYDMYKSDPVVSNNPFSPVFIQLLGPGEQR